MNTRFGLIIALTLVSTSSFAGDKILCTEKLPQWEPFLEGSEFAENVGEVFLFDIDAQTLTYASKSAINTLESRIMDDGRTIYGFFSSEEKKSDILIGSTRTFTRTEDEVPYELDYTVLLGGQEYGMKGEASIQLNGSSLKSMEGKGSCAYGAQSLNFAYCTSILAL